MSRTLQFRRYNSATIANTTGANGELIINTTNHTITVHDGTTPGGFATLNSQTDNNIDQFARNTANTATSNITILQGVNETQNTNITDATTLAQNAYDYANTIVSDTQIDPVARATANSADANTILIQGVNLTQNTNITNATNLAQAAYDYANTIISDTQIDQYARNTANTAQAVNETQNTNITFATNLAQAAFDAANTANGGGVTGNISIVSTNSAINFVANSSGDGYGYSTLELVPDTNATQDQYLIIDPTAPGHIHIRAGGTQDSSGAELFLGGENSYVKVGAGLNPPVTIKANTYSWDFDVNGDLAAPGKIYLNNGNENVLTFDQFGIRANTQMSLSAENFATGNNSTILFDKNGSGIVFRLEDTTPVSKNWSFYQNSLVFPDSSTQTTAFTGAGTDQYARNTANTAATTIPQNPQSTGYTLQSSDAGKHLYYTNNSAVSLYIPWTANTSWANGTTITIISNTTSNVSVTPNNGVSLYLAGNTTSASRNVTTYGMATLIMTAANTWYINGTGVI